MDKVDKVEELLTRGVEKIYPSKEGLGEVLKHKKITLYQGFDPTGDRLHIGHMIGLRKLAKFQKAGHHVIFVIGTGTGQAGDPSGKTIAREKFLSEEELRKNATDYVMQAKKILDFDGENKVVIRYNSDWFNKMTLPTFLTIIGQFSLQQLIERDLFQDRIKRGESINLRAFMYPILQGWDSVELGIDLEIGGSDQTFNMLMGRDMVRYRNPEKEKYVLATPLLVDVDGVKIGKSEGNIIGLTDEPSDLFGKIMRLPDGIIVKSLEYLTDLPMDEIKNIQEKIKEGENPITYKKRLAFEIVKQLNTEESARLAQENFEKVIPIFNPTFSFPQTFISNATIVSGTVAAQLASSNNEAKRLIEQKGISVDNKVIVNPNAPLSSFVKNNEVTIKRGSRKCGTLRFTK
jgi:tyrosyl-tRNA synthetase